MGYIANFMAKAKKPNKPVPEIPVIGEVDDWEEEVVKTLLDIPAGGECAFYIDSAGGSVYGALAVLTLLRHRRHTATAVVLGECSSAALLLFAGCQRRLVTRFSTFLFHKMRWQSEKRVGSEEALQWAKHFEEMEQELDNWQNQLFGGADEQLRTWTRIGRYVSGTEMVAAGLAEMLPL